MFIYVWVCTSSRTHKPTTGTMRGRSARSEIVVYACRYAHYVEYVSKMSICFMPYHINSMLFAHALGNFQERAERERVERERLAKDREEKEALERLELERQEAQRQMQLEKVR